MTDNTTTTTTARRTLLGLLLDRVEGGALLGAETPLLRPLVLAEQGAADGQTTDNDARPWIADALGIDIESDWGTIADAAHTNLHHRAAAQATIARVATALNSLGPLARFHIATALGDTDTADAARAEATGQRPTSDDEAVRAADSNVTDWATRVDEQCPAHYTGDEPRLSQPPDPVDYRCGRRSHDPASDHAVRQDQGTVFCWTDAIAMYPTGATEELAGAGISVCSPLVNPACPGHTGTDRCERAASRPEAATPDWEQQDAEHDRRDAFLDEHRWHEANRATTPIEEPTP